MPKKKHVKRNCRCGRCASGKGKGSKVRKLVRLSKSRKLKRRKKRAR